MRKEQRLHLQRIALNLYRSPRPYLEWFLTVSTETFIRRACVLLLTLSDGVPRSNATLVNELASHPDFADTNEKNRHQEISQTLNDLLNGGVPFSSIPSGGRGRSGAWTLDPASPALR